MNGINSDNKRKNIPGLDNIDDFTAINSKNNTFNANTENNVKKTVKTKNKSVNSKKLIITVIAIFIILLIAFCGYASTLPKDTMLKGMTVGGVDVGGLTPEQALISLNSHDSLSSDEVVINANGKEFVVLPSDIDASINIKATVDKAFNVGKSANIFSNVIDALRIKFFGGKMLPVITYDEEKFAEQINKIGIMAVGSQLIEHSVRFDKDGRAFAVPGKSGYNNDPEAVMDMVRAAILNSDSDVITVKFEKTAPQKFTLELLDNYIYKNPVNAKFVIKDGDVVLAEAENGRYIVKNECKNLVAKVKEGGEEIEIPYKTSEPEIKSADLKGKLFNAKLGEYTTRYAPGGNRGSNVATAASKINGTVLLSGESFSFNKTVGKRTIANGFKSAPEYQNGQTVTGIGGGTCQVSTTLYSAVLYSDLKVVKRSNHSMSVSYVPLGQDATVTDSGIDFVFKNDTEYPIKINAVTGGGKITVSIIGTKPDPARTVKISHKSVKGGIRTTRYVYSENGDLLKEEDMGLSKYKPHTKESESPSQTPAPTDLTDDYLQDIPGLNQTPAPSQVTTPATSEPPTSSPEATAAPSATTAPSTVAPQTATPATVAPAGAEKSDVPQNTESQNQTTPVKTEE